MKKLIIRDKQWGRGSARTHRDDSYLYNWKDDRMCCLGIACHQLFDVPKENMEHIGTPAALTEEIIKEHKIPKWLLESADVDHLIVLNDGENPSINANCRNQKIKQIFAKHNIQVEFRK